MSQTSFDTNPAAAFAGMQGDGNQDGYVVSRYNGEASGMPFGILVKQDTDQEKCKLYTASAKPAGVVLHSHYHDNQSLAGALGVPAADMANVLRKGRVWVLTEGTVAAGAQAYARHTSDGASNTQLGKFRADNDGVAQVTTVTPTSGNEKTFRLNVFVDGHLYYFEYLSDTASSATEICDGLRAAMAANAAFTALVVATGTATLILTGQTKGMAFDVVNGGGDGAFTSIVTGTAASTKADAVEGCRFVGARTGAGLVQVELNLA